MLGKIRTLTGDLANTVTLWGLMGSVGVSGVLGIVGPAILQPILELPAGLRVALGLCIFLVALAAILAGLKALSERDSRGKAAQDLSPQSSEYSLWQELKRVEVENQELRDSLQQHEQEAEQMKAKIGELVPYKRHSDLKATLFLAYFWGSKLPSAANPDADVMEEEWVSLTSGLIRTTLGDATANSFVVKNGDTSLTGRLERLVRIRRDMADKAAEVPPEFDSFAWINRYHAALHKLLPPADASQA